MSVLLGIGGLLPLAPIVSLGAVPFVERPFLRHGGRLSLTTSSGQGAVALEDNVSDVQRRSIRMGSEEPGAGKGWAGA